MKENEGSHVIESYWFYRRPIMCKIAHRYYGSFQFNYLCDMAEWGKGDPRWIVEERPDGKKTNDTFFYLKYNF